MGVYANQKAVELLVKLKERIKTKSQENKKHKDKK